MHADHDAFWDTLDQDDEALRTTALMAQAKVEAAPIWGFVTASESEQEFHHRVALSEQGLHRVASVVAGEGTPDYIAVVAQLPQEWFSDWQTLRSKTSASLSDFDWYYEYDQDYANVEGEDAVIVYLATEGGEVVDSLGGITGDFQISDHGNINPSPEFEEYLESTAQDMAENYEGNAAAGTLGSKKTASRPLYEIAQEIKRDWAQVNFGAVPYLDAMGGLDDISSRYGADDAKSIVLYFLNNASSWRGETAKRIKAELKAMVKSGSKTAGKWYEEGVVGKQMLGMPGSKITAVEPSAEYLTEGPMGNMTPQNDFLITFTHGDGRESKIYKSYDWLEKTQNKGSTVTAGADSGTTLFPPSDPGFGTIYGSERVPAYVTNDGVEVWMWRKGQKVRFYDVNGNQVGPEQSNVAPAVAYAQGEGWTNPGGPKMQWMAAASELGEPEKADCPKCGTASYSPIAKYCPSCGYKGEKTSSKTASDDDWYHGDHWSINVNPYAGVRWFVFSTDGSGDEDEELASGGADYGDYITLDEARKQVNEALKANGLPGDAFGPASTSVRYTDTSPGRTYSKQAGSRYSDDPYWMEATRYPGNCRTCKRAVPRGAPALYWPLMRKKGDNPIECEQCGETSWARFQGEVADEDFMSMGSKTAGFSVGERVRVSDENYVRAGTEGTVTDVTSSGTGSSLVSVLMGDGETAFYYEEALTKVGSKRTATKYCKTHSVWIGEGNAANHDEACKIEDRATKDSSRHQADIISDIRNVMTNVHGVDPALVAKLSDADVNAIWRRWGSEEVPTQNWDLGLDRGEVLKRRLRELITNLLIDRQMTGARKLAIGLLYNWHDLGNGVAETHTEQCYLMVQPGADAPYEYLVEDLEGGGVLSGTSESLMDAKLNAEAVAYNEFEYDSGGGGYEPMGDFAMNGSKKTAAKYCPECNTAFKCAQGHAPKGDEKVCEQCHGKFRCSGGHYVKSASKKTADHSDTCPQCGAHMDDVVQHQTGDGPASYVLKAKCDACGWSGQKKRSASKTATVNRTWADGYGNWHAIVHAPGGEAEARKEARDAIVQALTEREGPGFAPEVIGVALTQSAGPEYHYVETNKHSEDPEWQEFHGEGPPEHKGWYGSKTAMPEAPSGRDYDVPTLLNQIGRGNILAISGGRVNPIPGGVALPVAQGYVVEVTLEANDTYTVKRVFRGKTKGVVDNVYNDQVGEIAYRASCFHDGDFGTTASSRTAAQADDTLEEAIDVALANIPIQKRVVAPEAWTGYIIVKRPERGYSMNYYVTQDQPQAPGGMMAPAQWPPTGEIVARVDINGNVTKTGSSRTPSRRPVASRNRPVASQNTTGRSTHPWIVTADITPTQPSGAADIPTVTKSGWYIVDARHEPLHGPFATAEEANRVNTGRINTYDRGWVVHLQAPVTDPDSASATQLDHVAALHPWMANAIDKTASVSWSATIDQWQSAAGYLSHEWGDYGYRIKQDDRPGVFECSHSDGSRFYISADAYGNTGDVTASKRTAGESLGGAWLYLAFPARGEVWGPYRVDDPVAARLLAEDPSGQWVADYDEAIALAGSPLTTGSRRTATTFEVKPAQHTTDRWAIFMREYPYNQVSDSMGSKEEALKKAEEWNEGSIEMGHHPYVDTPSRSTLGPRGTASKHTPPAIHCSDCDKTFGSMYDASGHESATGHKTTGWGDRRASRHHAAQDSNSFPEKEPNEQEAPPDPAQAPGAAPGVPQQPATPGMDVATVQPGDALLDSPAGGTEVLTYTVQKATDQGDTMLLDVLKNGSEQMQLAIPKNEQVQVHTNADPSVPTPEADAPEVPAEKGEGSVDEDDPAAAKDLDGDGKAPPVDKDGDGKTKVGDEDPDEKKKKNPFKGFPTKSSKEGGLTIEIDPEKLDDHTLGKVMKAVRR